MDSGPIRDCVVVEDLTVQSGTVLMMLITGHRWINSKLSPEATAGKVNNSRGNTAIRVVIAEID